MYSIYNVHDCTVCSVSVVFKVIYVDATYTTAVLYTCLDVQQHDGTCARDSEHVSIISQSRDRAADDIELMSRVYDAINHALCVDVYNMEKPAIEGMYCLRVLSAWSVTNMYVCFCGHVHESTVTTSLDQCQETPVINTRLNYHFLA